VSRTRRAKGEETTHATESVEGTTHATKSVEGTTHVTKRAEEKRSIEEKKRDVEIEEMTPVIESDADRVQAPTEADETTT
jgi:hypothetical protein